MTQFSILQSGRYDAAIIDLDGTMVDTMGDFIAALNLMLRELGLDVVDGAVVALWVGKGSENLVKSALDHALKLPKSAPNTSETVTTFEQALDLYQQHYRSINGQHAQVYPGVVEGLQALRETGVKMACLTNKPLGFARELLKLKGLDAFFSQVFGGDSFEAKKPHALPVIKTCQALGTLPERTFMVGDSSNDAEAARAAGCPVVLMTYGYNHGLPVATAGADATIESFTELVPLMGLKETVAR